MDRGRHAHPLLHLGDGCGGVAEGHARREIEGNRDRRKLALVIDREWGGRRREMRDGAERDFLSDGRADVNVIQ